MKKYMVAAVSFVVGAFSFAQTLEETIRKTDNELYEQANGDFKTLIAKEPAKAENYFYYGENLLLQQGPEAAYPMWQKAAEVAPETPFGKLAKGKLLWYKGDTAAARQQFIVAAGEKRNKNPEVMRQIGATYTYAPVKNLNAAITILNEAIKLEPKNVDGYLILGDALLEKTPTNGSPAIEQYNKVLYNIDAKSARAIVRKGKLYQRTRAYQEANDLYQEAQAADPTYAPAYSANAELNMQFNQYKRAIENWEKYLELNNSTEARYRYASSLFGGRQYCEAIKELETLEKQGFTNMYTHRMMAYSLYECNPDENLEVNKRGLAESDKFFKIVPKEKIIALDHQYRGRHYAQMGNDSLAVIEYEKAIGVDTNVRAELYGEIGKMHMKSKRYEAAIEAYEAKKQFASLNAVEEFELGRAYYFGTKNYALADTAFAHLTQLAPDYAPGYYWKAKSAYRLDNNATWAAKPYYEKYLQTLTEEDKASPSHKSLQIEAAKYLGDYYVNSPEKDITQAKMYWNRVLELDPTDAQAKKVLSTLK